MKDLWSVSQLEVVWSRPLRSLVLSWPQVPAALKLTKHVFMLATKSQNSEGGFCFVFFVFKHKMLTYSFFRVVMWFQNPE